MSELLCLVCGKPNPENAETCQFCGSDLKQDTLGLPDWMNAARRTSTGQPTVPDTTAPPTPSTPAAAPQPEAPAAPDYLAGLSNLGADEEDDSPDWLNSLQGVLPAPLTPQPVPTPKAPPAAAPSRSTPPPAEPEENTPFTSQPPVFHYDDQEQAASQPRDDSGDWLRGLDGSSPPAGPGPQGGTPAKPAPAESGAFSDLPDWLASLTGSADATAAPSDSERAPRATGSLDWISGLGGGFTADETPVTPESQDWSPQPFMDDSGSQADWLSNLGAGTPATPAAPDSSSPFSEDESMADWSVGMQGTADNVFTQGGEPANFQLPGLSTSDGLPDWMSGLRDANPSDSGPATPTVSPFGDMPDWMAGLQDSTGSQQPAGPASSQAFDEMPDWMTNLQSASPASPSEPLQTQAPAASPDDDSAAWLASLQGFEAGTPPGADVQDVSAAPDKLPFEQNPEWLAGLQSSGSQVVGETPAAPLDDNQDWMSELQDVTLTSESDSGANPVISSMPPAGLPVEGDLPDWLTAMQNNAAPVTEQTPAAQAFTSQSFVLPSDDEVPDWLSGLQGPAAPVSATPLPAEPLPSTPAPSSAPAAAPASEEVPDWLAALQGSAPMITTDNLVPDTLTGAQKPAALTGTGSLTPPDTGNLPDWLSRAIETNAAEQKSAQSAPLPPTVRIERQPATPPVETSPAAHADEGALTLGQSMDSSAMSLDTPEWLSNFMPSEKPTTPMMLPPAQPPSADAKDNLPTAELPSWVQALRPMESLVAETNDSGEAQVVENEGPLAGLSSVLPTQVLSPLRAPRAYPNELVTSDTQKAQVALLENLIKSERAAQAAPKRARASRFQPLRLGVVAALLLVVLIFAALGSKAFPAPAAPLQSSPVGAFYKTISGLPEGAQLLVVLDYQPGYAGEMESALSGVIDQLMSKKVRLAFVSTSPVGGLMADRLLQKFSGLYAYFNGQQYVQLGYLPGGASGIRSFAENPAATLGQDTRLGNLWTTPALKDLAPANTQVSLSNFAALIVATDNPDIGRLWIEQAGPALDGKPLLMAVSAQAEPLIQPYWASRQVSGLLSGVEGGLSYESAAGKFGQARLYWDAYSAGLMVFELVILIGGAWSLRAGLRARRAEVEQDEE